MAFIDVKINGATSALVHLNRKIIACICRWKDKNGLEDLIKAKHEIDLLIEIHRVN